MAHTIETERKLQAKKCHPEHPDHSGALNRLRRVRGQVAGIERMVEERRYCVDILTQFKAVTSALRAVEKEVLQKHIQGCIRDAVSARDPKQSEAKIREILEYLT